MSLIIIIIVIIIIVIIIIITNAILCFPRHSQSQGAVERSNRDVEDILKAWKKDTKSNNWASALPIVQYTKNARLTCSHYFLSSSFLCLFFLFLLPFYFFIFLCLCSFLLLVLHILLILSLIAFLQAPQWHRPLSLHGHVRQGASSGGGAPGPGQGHH